MPTGTNLTYTGGTTHRPLPRATDQAGRLPHTLTTAKPKTNGIDFDALLRRCNICGEKKSGRLVDGACGDCAGVVGATQPDVPATTTVGDSSYVSYDQEQLATTFGDTARPTTGPDPEDPTRDLGGWQIVKIPGFSMGKQWMAVTPGCPETAHPTRDCGCRAVATIAEARKYIHFQLDDGSAAGEVRTRFVETQTPSPAAPTHASADLVATDVVVPRSPGTAAGEGPITPQVKAKIRQVTPDDITITLRGPGLARRQTEIAQLLSNLLAGLHQTPAPAPAATSTAQGREKREDDARTGKPTSSSRANRDDIDEQAVVRQYAAGDTPPAIAKRHSTTAKRVRAILDRHQVPRRDDRSAHSGGNNRWEPTPDQIADITQLYVGGHRALNVIGDKYDVDRRTIHRVLTENGVTIRPPLNERSTDITPGLIDQAIELYKGGASLANIARTVHVRKDRIRDALLTHGIDLRAAHGPTTTGYSTQRAETAAIRTWAKTQGLLDPDRVTGRLPRAVIDAYTQAHPTHQEENPAHV